jgi:serine/threonine-protein kinase HipA
MPQANVYCRGEFAGTLTKDPGGGYRFEYASEYWKNPRAPSISLTLPKRESPFESLTLFAFFIGLLAEGDDSQHQCRQLRIDENDYFTRLIRTCGAETIGGVTVREVEDR